MAKLKLDLHELFNPRVIKEASGFNRRSVTQGDRIEQELDRIMREAIEKRIALVEIIPGKGSGQLKKRVLRYLAAPQVRKLYHRYDVDNRNFGRLFVHFRHQRD